jgi:hypothetical protein
MEFNIENLKRRSQQIAEETRQGKNTAERIGTMFYDTAVEIGDVYKKINKRTFIMTFVSIVTSIASLVLSIFKSDDITVDGANLLGVMVGVLSFIVTLVLGYQIYKTIEIEEIIDRRMNSIESRMYDSLKTFIEVKIDEKMNKGKQ